MKNKWWFVPDLSLGLTICMFLNACSLMDIDRPLPPPESLWEKKGMSEAQKIADLRQCTKISTYSSPGEDWNDFDRCMLKKGYKYVPKPKGQRNICLLFPERLACKSASGEIKIEPDKSQIIPPASIQKQ